MKWFRKQKERVIEFSTGHKQSKVTMPYNKQTDPLLKRVFLFQDTKDGRELAKSFESHKKGHFFYTDDFLDCAFFPHANEHEDFFLAPKRENEGAKRKKHFTDWITFDVLSNDNLTKYCMAGYELHVVISKHSSNQGYASMTISDKLSMRA